MTFRDEARDDLSLTLLTENLGDDFVRYTYGRCAVYHDEYNSFDALEALRNNKLISNYTQGRYGSSIFNLRFSDGLTPLSKAVLRNDKNLVVWLINVAKADPGLRILPKIGRFPPIYYGRSPFELALINGNTEIADILEATNKW